MNDIKMEMVDINALIPYINNARVHSDSQIQKLRGSLREFGFVNPVLVDGSLNVIAGHGRITAAKLENIEQVPCVFVEHLSKAQQKAYILADNRLALDAVWDDALLKNEIETLKEMDFDVNLIGFDGSEMSVFAGMDDLGEEDDAYSSKIFIPQYEITGACPIIEDMLDTDKYHVLVAEINDADIPDDAKEFLRFAAARHLLFNYRNCAEYYAHADPDVQALMERSALVIIDFEDAIANGYVRLTADIEAMRDQDYEG